ncbi:MAG: helix-turn-helix domain-containing protein [Solirubrobacterales bacterium]
MLSEAIIRQYAHGARVSPAVAGQDRRAGGGRAATLARQPLPHRRAAARAAPPPRTHSARASELSGVQQADISRIERGETQPTTVTARRLADALGADFGFYETDTAGKAVPVEPASVKAA